MTLEQEIQHHMARTFFASAWADQLDGSDNSLPGGTDIMDVMPAAIDPAAVHAARTLFMDMEQHNKLPMVSIYASAQLACDGTGDRELTPENFGHYCAMQAMGHGVGLSDAFGQDVWKVIWVPYVEFSDASLEIDYFIPKGSEH